MKFISFAQAVRIAGADWASFRNWVKSGLSPKPYIINGREMWSLREMLELQRFRGNRTNTEIKAFVRKQMAKREK